MFCTKCGAQNPDDAKFCHGCGTVLPVEGMTPPQSPVAAAPAPRPVLYAGFWRRFLALIIDGLILAIPNMILRMALGLNAFTLLAECADGNFDASNFMPLIAGLIRSAMILTVISFVLDWLYHALFESSNMQATPGKLALGIVVTDTEGKRIDFLRASGRHFGKIISGLTLMIGYMMAGWTKRKQALHDIMADCLVVLK